MIDHILSSLAILAVGVVYGTDVFHALIVKKAATLSSDRSITDLMGHTHLIADKRMPAIGITGIVCTLILLLLNLNTLCAAHAGIALLAQLIHLFIYFRIAKPINTQMAAAAVTKAELPNVRALQQRWDDVIGYRAILLTIAMAALLISTF